MKRLDSLLNDGSFAGREQAPILYACKWCGRRTENRSCKCDDCLRDIEEQRRIDVRRGK